MGSEYALVGVGSAGAGSLSGRQCGVTGICLEPKIRLGFEMGPPRCGPH